MQSPRVHPTVPESFDDVELADIERQAVLLPDDAETEPSVPTRAIRSKSKLRRAFAGVSAATDMELIIKKRNLWYNHKLNPDHPLMARWELWVNMLCAYVAFVTPTLIAFQIETCPGQLLWYTDLVVDVSFVIDITTRFWTRLRDANGNPDFGAQRSPAWDYIGCGCCCRACDWFNPKLWKRDAAGTIEWERCCGLPWRPKALPANSSELSGSKPCCGTGRRCGKANGCLWHSYKDYRDSDSSDDDSGSTVQERTGCSRDIAPVPSMSWFIVDLLAVLPALAGYIVLIGTGVCEQRSGLHQIFGSGEISADGSMQLTKMFKLLRLLRILKMLRLSRLRKWWARLVRSLLYTMPARG